MNVKIGKRTIGANHPTFIIAEVGSAHQGEVETCKKIIKKTSETGADAIKFQKFICDELIVRTDPRYKTFEKIEINDDRWREIVRYAKKFNLELLADVFDERSSDLMDELGVKAFKIHSTDLTNPYLISHVAKKRKLVLLATGGSTLEEIKNAINVIKSCSNENVVLIHGFQSYPTRAEDTNFKFIQTLKDTFGLNVGYHDHVDAESELSLILPCMAIALGASVIEKHITLDRSLRGFDYHSALHPDEFEKMVKNIREVERSFGSGLCESSDAEKIYRATVKKNIVARVDIPSGAVISMDMLAFKRSEPGLPPSEAGKIMGKKAKTAIKKDEIITWDKLS